MKIRWLQYFLTVAEEQSVSRATTRLNTSQAGLSRVIRELESTLDVDLFQRTGRGMHLTAEGQILAEKARVVVAGYEDLMASVAELGAGPTGSLTIQIPMRLSRFVMKPLFAELDRMGPGVSVDIYEALSTDIQGALQKHDIDIGLYYSPRVTGGAGGERIATEALYVAGTPDVVGPADTPIRMEEASRLPFLMQSAPATYRDFVEGAFAAQGHPFRVARALNTIDAHLDYARSGEAATVLAYSALSRDHDAGQLCVRKIVEPEITRDIYICTGSQSATALQRDAVAAMKRALSGCFEALRWTPVHGAR